MRSSLLFTALLCLALNVYSQSFDVLYDQKDIHVHLSGFFNSGTNTIGSSNLYLHRNNDSEAGYIKWNLNKAKSVYEEVNVGDNIDFWQVGIDAGDDFRISKYKYRYYEITGGIDGTDDAMIIKDTYSGNNPTTEPKVIFPGGSVEIGSESKLVSNTNGILKFEGTDFIPYDCGVELGSGNKPWAEVVSQEFVTVNGCDALQLERKSGFKALSAIMKIENYHQPPLKSTEQGSFYLNPSDILKVLPEAVRDFSDYDSSDPNLNDPSNKVLGIKYDQLIPVLIQAIQEQQELINRLTNRLEDIDLSGEE